MEQATKTTRYDATYRDIPFTLTKVRKNFGTYVSKDSYVSQVITANIKLGKDIIKTYEKDITDLGSGKKEISFLNGDKLIFTILDENTICFDTNNFNIPKQYTTDRYMEYKAKVVIDHFLNGTIKLKLSSYKTSNSEFNIEL